MAHVYTEEENFENIANAIREKNGTNNTYAPSEMASAIEDLKVGELDFSSIYDAEQANEINQYYKDGIEYAKKIVREWDENITSVRLKFRDNLNIVFFPKINMENVIDAFGVFYDAKNLEYLSDELDFSNVESMTYAFFRCNRLKSINLNLSSATMGTDMCNLCASLRYAKLHTPNIKSLENAFSNCFSMLEIHLTDVSECDNFTNTFNGCGWLKNIKIEKWKQADINLRATYVTPDSINYIIEHALGADEGAVERVLGVHSGEFTAWQNSPNYEYYQAMAIEKLISVAIV